MIQFLQGWILMKSVKWASEKCIWHCFSWINSIEIMTPCLLFPLLNDNIALKESFFEDCFYCWQINHQRSRILSVIMQKSFYCFHFCAKDVEIWLFCSFYQHLSFKSVLNVSWCLYDTQLIRGCIYLFYLSAFVYYINKDYKNMYFVRIICPICDILDTYITMRYIANIHQLWGEETETDNYIN
jgi:hypothetical protein